MKTIKKTSNNYQKWEMVFPFFLAISVYALGIWLGGIRLADIKAKHGEALPSSAEWGFIALNIALFTISFILAYIAAHPKYDIAKLFNHLFNVLKSLKKYLSKKIKELQGHVRKEQKEEAKIIQSFQEQKEIVLDKVPYLELEVLYQSNKINYLQALLFETAKQIEFESETEKQMFWRKFIETSSGNTTPKVMGEMAKKIEHNNEFYEFCLPFEKNINEKENDMNEVITEPEVEIAKESPELFSKKNGKAFFYPALVSIGLSGMFACNIPEPKVTEMVLKIDVTPVASEKGLVNTVKLLDLMEINKNTPDNCATVTIGAVNDISRNKENNVMLGVDESGNPHVRKREIEAFAKEIRGHIDDIFESAKDYNKSKIYSSISESLITLSEKKADRKILVIVSDMLENTNKISLYELFLYETPDYEPIIKTLEADTHLPDLTGIEIIIVYSTTDTEIDDLVRNTQKFWKHFFEIKGAKVIFKANL